MARTQEDTKNAPRHRSIVDNHYTLNPNFDSTRSTGTKRLFSNRESRVAVPTDTYGENSFEGQDAEKGSSGKRHRNSDWPLSSNNNSPVQNNTSSQRPPLRPRNAPNSPNLRRPNATLPRPSRFVEGSMKDRVSFVPPEPYTGNSEELLAPYNSQQNTVTLPRTFTHYPNTSFAEESANIKDMDAARSSGIFRFGKSLAASFNPSNWKIWQKPQAVESPELKMLKERKDKAEKMYQELKASGVFREATVGQQSYYNLAAELSASDAAGKQNSRVQLGQEGEISDILRGMSKADKRKGMVFLESPRLLSPQPTDDTVVNGLDGKHPSNNEPLLREPKNSESPVSYRSSNGHSARRIPSRKDMQKQQKLVKRVSNLECKLEAARQKLAEALSAQSTPQQSPKPEKSRFVPGSLASLPSERLLSAHLRYEGGLDMYDEQGFDSIGQAVTTDDMMRKETNTLESRFDSTEPDLHKPLPPIRVKHDHTDHLVRSVEYDEGIGKHDGKASKAQQHHQASPADKLGLTCSPNEVTVKYNADSPQQSRAGGFLRKRQLAAVKRESDDNDFDKSSEIAINEFNDDFTLTPRKLQLKNPSHPRPHKLQRTSQKQGGSNVNEPLFMEKINSVNLHMKPPAQHVGNQAKHSMHTPRKSHNTKTKLTAARQPATSPSSSSNTGIAIDYHGQSRNNSGSLNEDPGPLPNQSPADKPQNTIPPVPALPPALRLLPPSEIMTANHAAHTPVRVKSKLTKNRPVLKDNSKTELEAGLKHAVLHEEFEWDEDVF